METIAPNNPLFTLNSEETIFNRSIINKNSTPPFQAAVGMARVRAVLVSDLDDLVLRFQARDDPDP
jgi:hypothetical protein